MILYDLGARLGEALPHFTLSSYSKIIGYEANPDIKDIPPGYTEWVGSAAWIYDGTITYVVGDNLSDCSGVDSYNCLYARPNVFSRKVEVPCVDFPKVVSENGICDIKMDVEGAEWVLIPALLPHSNLIKNLYVEWHFSESGNPATAQEFSDKLKAGGTSVHLWF